MHRTLSCVLAALGALALLSACGSDDDATATTTSTTEATTTTSEPEETGPEGTDVDEWAEAFCADLTTWREGVGSGDPDVGDLDPEDPAAAQTAVVEVLDGLREETDQLIASTEALDPPAIDDGDAFVEALVERFEGVSASAAAARDDVEALSTDDPAAFQAGVAEAVDSVQAELNLFAASFETIDESFDDPDLQAALAASCT